jgi:ABC-type branched-subunit amino acid transport system substrate-binding protein
MMTRNRLATAATVAALVAITVCVGATPATATGGLVTVERGQPVQIAAVLDLTGIVGSSFGPGIEKAIDLAVANHPAVRGFPIQVTTSDVPCVTLAGDQVSLNLQAAQNVVADAQNVAVIGHMCSQGLGGDCGAEANALATYEAAGVLAVTGSATAACLPALGPTVFDRTAIPDGLATDFDTWYALIQATPRDTAWRQAYQDAYGSSPPEFADLYYDATQLLITKLQQVSHMSGGDLVIDRAALARAMRATAGFQGVTCSTTIDPVTGDRVLDLAALARCAD